MKLCVRSKLLFNKRQPSGQSLGMRKLINFGQPCVNFPRKIFKETHDETAAWKIYDNKLKCSLKEKCKRK